MHKWGTDIEKETKAWKREKEIHAFLIIVSHNGKNRKEWSDWLSDRVNHWE